MSRTGSLRDECWPEHVLLHIEEVCNRFEAACQAGQRPRIEDFLGTAPAAESALLRRELQALASAYAGPLTQEEPPRLPQAVAMPPLTSEQKIDSSAELSKTAVECGPRQEEAATGSVKPAAEATFLSPPQAVDEIGRLGGYRVLRQLGEGGMGLVFEAEDVKLKRRVALKVMKPELAAKKQDHLRFLREAQSAAAVEHDHICRIYQVGEENGVPFIGMPFLKGEPLDARLKREKPLPIAEAVRIGLEVAEGLAAAHDAGLVHRDIKPGNIWLESQRGEPGVGGSASATGGRVKILDFGLARAQSDDAHLTTSGVILGTPAYMAPEQARNVPVDRRADLFSLGAILYEMTAGRRPFTGTDTMSILLSLATDVPSAPHLVNAAIPAELSDLILRLLAKTPDERPANARAVAEALRAILMQTSRPIGEVLAVAEAGPRGASATPRAAVDTEAWRSRARPPQRLRRRGALIATFTLLVLLIGAFATYQLLFKTADGTLVIEVDGDADVRFQNGELRIYDADGKLKHTLKPSDKTKALPPGPYKVEVAGAVGVNLETTEFTMPKHGTVTVRVTVDPLAVTKTDPTKDPDRRAAEYVLSIGGTVQVNEQQRDIKAATELSKESFRLTFVDLQKNQQASDAGLANLKDCKNLTALVLTGTRVTDAGLTHFKDCKNLTYLGLDNTDQVSDAGLANFKDCAKNLTYLLLRGDTLVTDAGLAHFKECKNLIQLGLSGTQVSDAGLAYFKDCKNLMYVQLGPMVTDAGLAHFKDCKNLRILYLLPGTPVTADGVKKFAAAFPQCKIISDRGVIEPKK